MHGSGGDWSTPKRSSKSKKKLRHCWVSHWRRQTATTSHDGCSCCPGADTRSDRQCLRGSERVARQRLPPTRPSGPAVGRALSQTEPTRLLSTSYAVFCLKKKKKCEVHDQCHLVGAVSTHSQASPTQ